MDFLSVILTGKWLNSANNKSLQPYFTPPQSRFCLELLEISSEHYSGQGFIFFALKSVLLTTFLPFGQVLEF